MINADWFLIMYSLDNFTFLQPNPPPVHPAFLSALPGAAGGEIIKLVFLVNQIYLAFVWCSVKINWLHSVSPVRLGHHHLAELIKVHGPGSVLIQFLDDSLQLLVSERSQELPDQSPQGLSGDEALALLVVDSERFFLSDTFKIFLIKYFFSIFF